MTPKPIRLMIVAEGNTDDRWVRMLLPIWLARCGVADRGGGAAPHAVVGPDDAASYLKVSQVPRRARSEGFKSFTPGEEGLARQALQLVKILAGRRELDAAVLLRDIDDAPQRAAAFAKAHAAVETIPVAVGTPEQCIEAWYLCGVDEAAPGVGAVLPDLKDSCGFHPLRSPHRLSHKNVAPRSAKRVADRLLAHVSEQAAARTLVERVHQLMRRADTREHLEEVLDRLAHLGVGVEDDAASPRATSSATGGPALNFRPPSAAPNPRPERLPPPTAQGPARSAARQVAPG